MAKTYLVSGPLCREVYVNEEPVGQGCANKRDDFMLVQLLLKIATESVPSSPGFLPPGAPTIETNGVCGPNTLAYIKYFQNEVDRRQNKKLIERDSRVDPVRSGATSSAISHTFYTILALNAAMRSPRANAFQIEKEPKFPFELKSAMFLNW